MESLGMKVLSVGLVLAAPCASLEGQLWTMAKLNATTLAAGKVTQVGPLSRMLCAAHATRTPSADLFCLDQGQCSVSDLKIASHQDDSLYGSGPVVKCWTKHACVWGGVGYAEGENITCNCLQKKCVNGKLVDANNPVLSSCVTPFENIGGGCFYRHSGAKSWCEARATCMQLGGDLATPANFDAFRQYMTSFGSGYMWIGGIRGEWLNGTAVADRLFYGSRGEGTCEVCISYQRYYHDYQTAHYHEGLTGRTCNITYHFVCEVKI